MCNIKYSIDKVKLEFQYIKTDRVQRFLKSLELCIGVRYYPSNKMVKCKHNFEFGDTETGTIYVGVIPNWEKEDKSDKNIVMEYNPNKVSPFFIEELAWLQNIPPLLIRVMNFDVACDMAVPFNTLRMLKRDVREYNCVIGHRNNETMYLGELGHNHIKLYDKAKEQKIKDVNWTRFEITVKKINSFGCTQKEFVECLNIPTIYSISNQLSFEYEQLDDIQRIVLESIIGDINILSTIKNYRTRKRYEELLSKFLNPVIININEMYKIFNDFGNNFANIVKIGEKDSEIDINAIFDDCEKRKISCKQYFKSKKPKNS